MFLLVRPLHVDVIVNASLSRIFFSIWPPVAVNILYFLFHAIDALGGGAIVETLKIREELTLAIDQSQAEKQKLKRTTGRNKLQINVGGQKYTALHM